LFLSLTNQIQSRSICHNFIKAKFVQKYFTFNIFSNLFSNLQQMKKKLEEMLSNFEEEKVDAKRAKLEGRT